MFNNSNFDLTDINLDRDNDLIKTFEFSSGCEPHIKSNSLTKNAHLFGNPKNGFRIICRIKNCNDIFKILLVTDALRRDYGNRRYIEIFIPYLPFARQDRQMNMGEPLSIKVFADIINAQKYDSVIFYDAHSDVGPALIDNSFNLFNRGLVINSLAENYDQLNTGQYPWQEYSNGKYLIVSPDSGAFKKIYKLCESINYRDHIVLCNKHRNVTNGVIDGIICDTDDFEGKDLFIVDDICDGGGTFVLLADELRKRNCGKINLIVSHGIFSKGINVLDNIDHIYTTDSINGVEKINNDKLTVFKLDDLL